MYFLNNSSLDGSRESELMYFVQMCDLYRKTLEIRD